MARTGQFWWDDDDVCFVQEQPTETTVNKLLNLDTLSWLIFSQSFLLFLKINATTKEAAHTNISLED